MSEFISQLNFSQLLNSFNETMIMTFVSLFVAVIIGGMVGIFLFSVQTGGLYENKYLSVIIDFIINFFRAIPFIILLILVLPLTKFLVGTFLGVKAALPSLSIAAIPFYARLCVIAFNEVDDGTVEAAVSMGASKLQIIRKIIIPESMPALVSATAVTGITLVSYTAMAGAIGSGGLGFVAYTYGFVRRNNPMLIVSTLMIVAIVFFIQAVGDYVARKLDKR